MTSVNIEPDPVPTPAPISWPERHIPTLFRCVRALQAIPPPSQKVLAALLAFLGVISLLVLIILASFAVNITSRP